MIRPNLQLNRFMKDTTEFWNQLYEHIQLYKNSCMQVLCKEWRKNKKEELPNISQKQWVDKIWFF